MCIPGQVVADMLAIELTAGNGSFLINGDAIASMALLPDKSVDMICVDLPYGTTQNKWDSIIPFSDLWTAFNRVGKTNAAMVFTAAQPFTSKLIMSNIANFKYDIIYEKSVSSGQLNVNKMPLRNHEAICVFYRSQPTYNEQTTIGNPSHSNGVKTTTAPTVQNTNHCYGTFNKTPTVISNVKRAKSVVKFSNPRIKNGHPTQKPIELMEYLIKTYSNPGDTVLDCCMGSGTTGVAAKKLGRSFIGIELDPTYFASAQKRIEAA